MSLKKRKFQVCPVCGKFVPILSKNHQIKCRVCGKVFCNNKNTYPRKSCSQECRVIWFKQHNPSKSPEARKKLSISLTGRTMSKEIRDKISEAHKGKATTFGFRLSEEHIEKLRRINLENKYYLLNKNKKRSRINPRKEHEDLIQLKLQELKSPELTILSDKIRPDIIVIDWKNRRVSSIEVELSNPYKKRRYYELNNLFNFDKVKIIYKNKQDQLIEWNLE